MKIKTNWISLLIIALLAYAGLIPCDAPVSAEIDFDAYPVWVSEDLYCSTGGAVADIDMDGFWDFIVSNGNDMEIESEIVYFGYQDGLQQTSGWTSSDTDYSGHCTVGDLNQDGLPELVVANYIGSVQGFTETFSKIYYNTGYGFESAPSWMTADLNNTFSVTLGDVDNDGDLDIACANGEAYHNRPQPNDIYYNTDGLIDYLPGWTSSDEDSSYDLMFSDYDQDGDLDLAVANSGSPTKIYRNYNGNLETSASWLSDDSDNDNTLIWGDFNNDGWEDLVVITNKQLYGNGLIKIFSNHNGSIETSPSWSVDVSGDGYGSSLIGEDFDFDGDLDLAAGSWWGPVVIYENDGSALETTPEWTSSNDFVVESLQTYPDPTNHCKYLLATSWGDSSSGGANYGYLNLSIMPTITPSSPVLDLHINATSFYGNDPFICFTSVFNPGQSIEVDFYTLLEIAGLFLFYPSWQEDIDFDTIHLPQNDETIVDLFDFVMPDPIGYNGSMRIYSAIFYSNTYDLVCDYDWTECEFID